MAYTQVQDGYDSLQSFSEAQNVQLSSYEDRQLVDRGTTEGADAIMVLLTEDWGYPVEESDVDPNDPLVNTASEYMFQMATITFHTLHGTQTVVLTESVDYSDETFAAGEYEFDVNGFYRTDFDRTHPIEGPARDQAWNGTAHALIAELDVGTGTHSALQLGLVLAGTLAVVGLTVIVAGLGLVWATKEEKARKPQPPAAEPEAKKELEPVGQPEA